MDFKSLDFTSRKKLLATLAADLETLESELAETKSASLRVASNKKKYDGYLVAANTIRGVINGLEEKVMNRAEAEKLLAKAYRSAAASFGIETSLAAAPKVNEGFTVKLYEEDDIEKEEGVDTFVKKDGSSERDDTQIAEQISNLRLYRKNLPTTIKGVYSVAHVPIIPIFKNLAISTPAALKEAGFKTLHFSGDDLEGYVVMDNQAILLLDYAKYNKQFLAESMEDYEEELADYKEAYKEWKAKYSAWEEAREAYDEELEAYQKALVKYNSQLKAYQEYEKLKAAYPKLRQDFIKQMNLFKQGKRKDEPVAPKLVKPVKVPTKPEAPVEPPEEFDVAKPIRPKKPTDFDTDSLSDVVNDVLKELAENTNAEYVLVSDKYLRNPRAGSHKKTDGDVKKDKGGSGSGQEILCFWIAEKWKMRNLERKFGHVVVEDWGFPF